MPDSSPLPPARQHQPAAGRMRPAPPRPGPARTAGETSELSLPLPVVVAGEPGGSRDDLLRTLATCSLLRVRVAGSRSPAVVPAATRRPAAVGPAAPRPTRSAAAPGGSASVATVGVAPVPIATPRICPTRIGPAGPLAGAAHAAQQWAGEGNRREVRPGLVVLCSGHPAREMAGLVAAAGSAPILVVSGSSEESEVVRTLQGGAASYLVDGQFTATELLGAALGTAAGRNLLSPAALAAVVHRLQHPGRAGVSAELAGTLSRRERQVMELVAQGHPNSFIARREFIAEKTVRNHLNNIYAKLQVRSRAEAILIWWGRPRSESDGAGGAR